MKPILTALFLASLLSFLFFGGQVMFENDHYNFTSACIGTSSVSQEQKCVVQLINFVQILAAGGLLFYAAFFFSGMFKLYIVLRNILRIGVLQPKLCE